MKERRKKKLTYAGTYNQCWHCVEEAKNPSYPQISSIRLEGQRQANREWRSQVDFNIYVVEKSNTSKRDSRGKKRNAPSPKTPYPQNGHHSETAKSPPVLRWAFFSCSFISLQFLFNFADFRARGEIPLSVLRHHDSIIWVFSFYVLKCMQPSLIWFWFSGAEVVGLKKKDSFPEKFSVSVLNTALDTSYLRRIIFSVLHIGTDSHSVSKIFLWFL